MAKTTNDLRAIRDLFEAAVFEYNLREIEWEKQLDLILQFDA